MNFSRGKQVVIHNSTYRDWGGKPFIPPQSFATWPAAPSDRVSRILDDTAMLATAVGKLDAIHFISHGAPSFFQLGADNISMKNADVFLKLTDKARVIVIWACQVGGDISAGATQNPTSLGCAIAQLTNAKVIVGRENQAYGGAFVATSNGSGPRSFTPDFFWGEVYLCHPDGGHLVVYKNTGNNHSQINVEPYIFRS